jgi:N-formylmaleamate deformylase
VAELLAEKYDVIMPDAQGHGLSDRIDQNFTSKNHTHQVVGLIKQLDVNEPIIMGHSMGAGTAVNIAAEYPSLPKAIILEDPGWGIQESPISEQEEERIKQREEFIRSLTGAASRTREELIAECREANPRWSEAEIVPWAESKLQFDPKIFSTIQVDRPSYVQLVPKIICPTLLIISDGGIVTPEVAEHASKLWKAEYPFQWVQIKGAGHNIRREQFKTFCDTLFNFLKDIL